jgi:RimJ/RimL family protein N-acetyltransferase
MFIPPDMLAGMSKERHARLFAQAEADRLAREVRRARKQVRREATLARREAGLARHRRRSGAGLQPGQPVILRDGSQVLIRPVRDSDAPLLADGFGRLSDRSRWMRFLTAKPELKPSELRYFTDVDHHDHEALGALDHDEGRGVGIARYIRRPDDPSAAELAVTVIDEWQRRGLASALLARLSDRACEEGISRFVALVSADNTAMTRLLDTMCADVVRREYGTLTYELTLGCAQLSGAGCVPLRAG